MAIEIVEHNGTRYAEVIRADVAVRQTTFYSPTESRIIVRQDRRALASVQDRH
jgi:hypothetical protein